LLNWNELDERAALAKVEVAAAAEQAMYIAYVREELDLPQAESVRTKLARALVRMGVRLDPEAADWLAPVEGEAV
jgi:hypothetical protein